MNGFRRSEGIWVSLILASLVYARLPAFAELRLDLKREGGTAARFSVTDCPPGACYTVESCTNLSAPQWRSLAALGSAAVVVGGTHSGEEQALAAFSLEDIGQTRQAYFRLSRVAPVAEEITAGAGSTAVALLVNVSLAVQLRSALDQFAADLRLAGYSTIVADTAFSTPEELRAYLFGLYRRTQERLKAAILIGPQPYAYQWYRYVFANTNFPPSETECISFQFLSDLDGQFIASTGFSSPGDHASSFDRHEGAVDWEIVVGVLPVYEGDTTRTVEAVIRYCAKNHAYRTSQSVLPKGFLLVTEFFPASTPEEHASILAGLQTGSSAWTPFTTNANANIYFNSPPVGMSVDQGYAALTNGIADFTTLEAHGWYGGNGQLDLAWVRNHPIKTVVLWSDACSVGNLDYPTNWLTEVLYSPSSSVLIARGSTENSGGMGNNEEGFYGHNIASSLTRGTSFADALLRHVNVPLIWPWARDREYHFMLNVVLGDPTISIRP